MANWIFPWQQSKENRFVEVHREKNFGMYLLRKHKLKLDKACSPSHPNRKQERMSDDKLHGSKVTAAMCKAFRRLKKKFKKNLGERNSQPVGEKDNQPVVDQQKEHENDDTRESMKQICEKLVAYRLIKLIGRGGFGHVLAGTQKSDNLPVAIKFVRRKYVKEFVETGGEQMPSEAYFMKKIQHPNVIKLYQYLSVNDFCIYIMERPASCQDLQRVLRKRRLTEKEARRYFKQIIEATICCEENGVVHRDLKPENILLDKESDEIKIIDFGLASRIQYEPYNKFRGTRAYIPPEFLRSGWYDSCQSTVWTLGMILVDLISSSMAFSNPEEALLWPPRLPVYLTQEAKDLILWMLNVNPLKRPSLRQILRHPWMTVKDSVDDHEVSPSPVCSISLNLEDLASDERQTNCSSLLNIERLFVSASSMAIDKSYATSLSENTAMIGHSHQRIQDGQLHISPDMSNRNESTDKKSFDLERTHNGKSCVLRKRTLDSKYGGFDVNVCDRAVKHKKMFCDIRRNVKESNGRFDELWMLPKWLGKKVRWKIWTKFTKKNDQERRDWKRKNFILKLERRRSGEMKQRRTIFNYGKTVVRYKIEKKIPPFTT
ncbi:PREDICTED: CBL-interacting protein kinase 11-like [Acropora digitifera]|uniref:CBL-interacting protein kinase 11-like n=1 Tax=Acropora digitifera TaxID=70779 RepID=UPI00077B25E6|nr:PREDICTED: CBL-interacting protein kinase 11-like [Acropora digitifera]